jgi:hypothetical protein
MGQFQRDWKDPCRELGHRPKRGRRAACCDFGNLRALNYLDATDQFRALLRDIVNSEFAGEDNMWVSMDVYDEAILRIYCLCGIED